MNHSLRYSGFLLLYLLFVVTLTVAIIMDFFTEHSQYIHTHILIYGVYASVICVLFISSLIILILYARIMNSHYFFFIGSLLTAIPLMVMRAFLFDSAHRIFSQPETTHLFIKITSALHIHTMICLFLSIVFLNKRYMLNIIIFIIVGIISSFASSLGSITYTGNTIHTYIGGDTLAFYVSLTFYTVIILLYFFEFMTSKAQQGTALAYFFVIAGIIISLFILSIVSYSIIIVVAGFTMIVCLLMYVRNQFIRRL